MRRHVRDASGGDRKVQRVDEREVIEEYADERADDEEEEGDHQRQRVAPRVVDALVDVLDRQRMRRRVGIFLYERVAQPPARPARRQDGGRALEEVFAPVA